MQEMPDWILRRESMWRSLISDDFIDEDYICKCMMHYSRIGHQLQFAEFK